MSPRETVPSKTVLEYLVMINEQSYSGIGRQLGITLQQFSDWIKKRRPIPQERLQALATYFRIDGAVFADPNHFAAPLTPLKKVELHLLLLDQKVEQLEKEGAEEEDIEPYREKKRTLLIERAEQHRLAKHAALLQQNDARINRIVDTVIQELDAGRAEAEDWDWGGTTMSTAIFLSPEDTRLLGKNQDVPYTGAYMFTNNRNAAKTAFVQPSEQPAQWVSRCPRNITSGSTGGYGVQPHL
ncbi:hypothetical protein J31TS4_22990 [Paenibacillus sp. J31TS4]|uniref:hypothetical protein n=1 Tax=Paenibacillus sp. J31TS4 TaxID=2807195 RepID=UPI001B147616|nr:hypothetical protein [Paenibacillus sp. J31TS4]GIP39019.1 hypothetical protein J31TS4_22990 [Paenibacillus sp. J31TS4]